MFGTTDICGWSLSVRQELSGDKLWFKVIIEALLPVAEWMLTVEEFMKEAKS